MVGYAKYSGYNALGQVGKIEYQNGVTTGYEYEQLTNRLSRLRSPAPPELSALQDLEYIYDDVGNITDIIDHLSSANSQHFTYDDLNRLKTAQSGAFQAGTIDWDYDEIGNMTYNSKVGALPYEYATDYGCEYPSSKPHAVTRAGADAYCYDKNGNMTDKNRGAAGARRIEYDAENRVKSITSGGATVQFVYDHKGERVKKIQGGVETIYIGGALEIKGTETTKHYFGGGKRAATRKGNNLYYIHGDHLGSLSFATDTLDQEKQTTIYLPIW